MAKPVEKWNPGMDVSVPESSKTREARRKAMMARPAIQLFRAIGPVGSMPKGIYALLINRPSLAHLLMSALKKGLFPAAKDFVLEPDTLLPDMNAWFPSEPGTFGVSSYMADDWEERPWSEAPLYIEAVLRYLLNTFPRWGQWACTDADKNAALLPAYCGVPNCRFPSIEKENKEIGNSILELGPPIPATETSLCLMKGYLRFIPTCERHTLTPVKYLVDALNLKYSKG